MNKIELIKVAKAAKEVAKKYNEEKKRWMKKLISVDSIDITWKEVKYLEYKGLLALEKYCTAKDIQVSLEIEIQDYTDPILSLEYCLTFKHRLFSNKIEREIWREIKKMQND